MKKMIFLFSVIASLVGCNRPEPNYEGVLMTEYGRNGINSFKIVTGAQGMLGPGSELYQVPMWEQAGDPDVVEITAKDAGVFTVDPSYTYTPIRGKGAEIVFNYKNYRIQDPETFFDNVEANVLNKRVTDAYREEARNYTTDSLMNNLGKFELSVQKRLKEEFKTKFFDLTTLTSGLKPPASMLKAVEDRNKAIQEANRVKNELETSRMLLEKAKIDAETNKVQSVGLTKEILMQQYIEMLGKTSNKVIITDGRTPVILGN
ncbi:SPFH/Band 7/PHB domain protein [Capnocytophaga sp. oral taxon 863 str. F0517]|uniref:SPFH domain-containing protein n=1 Tax=Capnocytophaga sp. oral taxon 863 TaxID=1227265 RepID=UPI000396330D|nr:SPFH domain-containing protein [Capnocytophaga sp. oral taxon 863]ERI64317.1 SPFH/Band 7/PHB domain protein [Capnocytophaga sp. oral taxon 863 str. F0517]